MESVSRPPQHPALYGVVASLWVSVRPDAAPVELVLPSGQAQLVVDGDRCVSLLVGPRSRPSVVPSSRFAAGISLSPVGLCALSTFPPRELVDDVADADEVLGERMTACLDGSDPVDILDRLERQMLGLRREGTEPDQMVLEAERSIRAGSRLDAVTCALGVDRRQLVPAFRERVGLPPKRYQRLLRFQCAARAMRTPTPASLAAIAVGCGYADQAHMSRDFKEFSGRTPGQVHGVASTAHNHLSAVPDDQGRWALKTHRTPASSERALDRRSAPR